MFDRVLPIQSDHDLLRLAGEVIDADGPGGGERLTWVLLLDDTERPLPMLMPVEGVPVDPDPHEIDRLATALDRLIEGTAAAEVVLIWQRPGDSAVRMHEADWAAGLAAAGLPIRAQLLATDDGVRLLDPAFEAIVAV